MANDCLVTKLKSSVNNDNLPELGVLKVTIPAYTPAATSYINIIPVSGKTVRVTTENHNIWKGYTDTGSKILDVVANTSLRPSTEGDVIRFKGKYDIKELQIRFNGEFNIDDFAYIPLTRLQLQGLTSGKIKSLAGADLSTFLLYNYNSGEGSLSEISTQFPNLTSLTINSSLILTGRLEDIGNLASLAVINLTNCYNMSDSSIEKFVTKQVVNRTTGSITANIGNSKISFNGSVITALAQKTLSWQPNATTGRTDVTWDGVTITIDNTTGNKVS